MGRMSMGMMMMIVCACLQAVRGGAVSDAPPTPFCFPSGSHTPTRGRNRGGCVWVCGGEVAVNYFFLYFFSGLVKMYNPRKLAAILDF